MGMRSATLLAVFLAAAPAVANAQQKNSLAEIGKNPLTLYVAHGEENACGPGCSEWIAAEGAFDPDSSARFRNFLRRLGQSKLPVYFDSPGGLQNQAREIGIMMRLRGITAGVARTRPEICTNRYVDKCRTAKKSGQRLRAMWTDSGAQCNSACLYALVGAVERRIPPGSRIGIHSPSPVCVSSDRTIANFKGGQCVAPAEESRTAAERFMKQMGVDPRLIDAIYKVPNSKVRFLSRDEIQRYGIDGISETKTKLTAHDSAPARGTALKQYPWTRRPGTMSTIVKIFELETARGPQRSALEAGCHYSLGTQFAYFHSVPDGASPPVTIAVIVNGQRFEFLDKGTASRFEFIDSKGWFERRQIWIPIDLIDPFDLQIEAGRADGGDRPLTIDVSVSGFLEAWKTVTANC